VPVAGGVTLADATQFASLFRRPRVSRMLGVVVPRFKMGIFTNLRREDLYLKGEAARFPGSRRDWTGRSTPMLPAKTQPRLAAIEGRDSPEYAVYDASKK
jgi:hypothetical protein